MTNRVRAALGVAGLALLLSGAYWGARAVADAFGVGGSPPVGIARPGITGIAAGPSPEAPSVVPVRTPDESPQAGDQGVSLDETTAPAEGSVRSQPTTDGGEGEQTDGGGSSPSPDSSQPSPELPEKEEPPIIRYPGN